MRQMIVRPSLLNLFEGNRICAAGDGTGGTHQPRVARSASSRLSESSRAQAPNFQEVMARTVDDGPAFSLSECL